MIYKWFSSWRPKNVPTRSKISSTHTQTHTHTHTHLPSSTHTHSIVNRGLIKSHYEENGANPNAFYTVAMETNYL